MPLGFCLKSASLSGVLAALESREKQVQRWDWKETERVAGGAMAAGAGEKHAVRRWDLGKSGGSGGFLVRGEAKELAEFSPRSDFQKGEKPLIPLFQDFSLFPLFFLFSRPKPDFMDRAAAGPGHQNKPSSHNGFLGNPASEALEICRGASAIRQAIAFLNNQP